MGQTANLPTAGRPRDAGQVVNRIILWLGSGLALVVLLVVVLETLGFLTLSVSTGAAAAVLVISATVSTLAALCRHLPLQNVLLASAIIAGMGGLAHLLAAITALPFGPIHFPAASGPRCLGQLGWAMPLVWLVVVLNSRGVARLILRPWRKIRAYGYWLIGLTVALSVLLDAALEPFASVTHQFWIWLPTRLPLSWYGVPVSNLAGWLLTATLIMAFTAPALINKRQRPQSVPPDYHPLGVWLSALALFSIAAFHRQLWWAGGYGVVLGLTVAMFAGRGARW